MSPSPIMCFNLALPTNNIINTIIHITITVLISGSKKINIVIRHRIKNGGNRMFLSLRSCLYLRSRLSPNNIMRASFANSDGCILKILRSNHLLAPPISFENPGIKTRARSPIIIKIIKYENFL